MTANHPATAPNPSPAPLITEAEVAALCAVTEGELAAMVKCGALPPPVIKCGRMRRWNRQQVLASIGEAQ